MSQFKSRVTSSTNNDGSKYIPDGSWATYMCRIGSEVKLAFRILNVTVPKNSTIDSAYIRIVAMLSEYDDTFRMKVYGIDEDNTGAMSSDPTGRAKTTATVDWDISGEFDSDTTYTSPNIKSIVQEIVNRSGWSSGNAMGFIILDDGSTDEAAFLYDYENDSSKAIQLEINYSESTSTTTATSSTTTTSTTSSSTTTRIPSNWGLKVSKFGYDVKEIDDLKNYIFTSAKGVLGLRQLSTYSGTTNASGDISLTKAHNFGYVPITIVSYTTISTSAPNSIITGKEVLLPLTWHSYYLNSSRELIEVTETTNFSIDSTNIYITLHAEYFNHDTFDSGDLVGINYTFKVYYYFNEISDE